MRKRIMDAYRVLRGELVATPRVQVPSVWMNPPTYTSAGSSFRVTFNQGK